MSKTKKTEAQQKEARKEAQKRYYFEKKVSMWFVVSGGFPKCAITGKKLKNPTGRQAKEGEISVHHEKPQNGYKAKSRKQRIDRNWNDMGILLILDAVEHQKLNRNIGFTEESWLETNNFLSGKIQD